MRTSIHAAAPSSQRSWSHGSCGFSVTPIGSAVLTSIAVLTPVLARSHLVAPLLASLEAAAEPGVQIRPFFLCSPGDLDVIDAVVAAGEQPWVVPWKPGRGDYAHKVNWGAQRAVSMGFDWFLLAADDVRYHPGWARAALAAHESTGALAIGTNDLGNPDVMAGKYATHPMAHRDYLACGTVDDPEGRLLFHPGYWHEGCDAEFAGTARMRGTWAYAADSIVEHLHHLWGKGEDDAVYAGSREHVEADRALYRRRRRLWTQ
jgi:hypothetical protein